MPEHVTSATINIVDLQGLEPFMIAPWKASLTLGLSGPTVYLRQVAACGPAGDQFNVRLTLSVSAPTEEVPSGLYWHAERVADRRRGEPAAAASFYDCGAADDADHAWASLQAAIVRAALHEFAAAAA